MTATEQEMNRAYYMTPAGLRWAGDQEIEEMSNDAYERMNHAYGQQIGGGIAGISGKPTIYRSPDEWLQPAKSVKKDYNTVAVKFISGSNLGKSYTYRVVKRAKLRLGQEVVVPTTRDGCTTTTIAVVVELHSKPQDTGAYDYKFVTGTVKPL